MGSGIGGNDPLLVVAIVPVPEDDESAVVDALVAVKGVQVQSGVVHHPDRSEPVAQVPALRPQDRLVHRVRVVRRHLDRMRSADGVLDGLVGELVDEREAGKALRVFDPSAVLFVFIPLLRRIRRIGARQNHFAVADGRHVFGIHFAVHLHRRLSRHLVHARKLVPVPVNHRRSVVVPVTLVGHVDYCRRRRMMGRSPSLLRVIAVPMVVVPKWVFHIERERERTESDCGVVFDFQDLIEIWIVNQINQNYIIYTHPI